MKIVIICNDYYPLIGATAKAANKIIERFPKDNVIYVFSKGYKSKVNKDNIINYQINTTDLKPNRIYKWPRFLITKVFNKLYKTFNHKVMRFANQFYRKIIKTVGKDHIDFILSFSGPYWAQITALKVSKKLKIKHFMFYTDPFFENSINDGVDVSVITRIEERCLENASCIFMPEIYFQYYESIYKKYINKFISCEIPSFFNKEELKIINSQEKGNFLLYPGGFYKSFRSPIIMEEFSQTVPNFNILCLSELTKSIHAINVKCLNSLTGSDYLKIYGSSLAIIVIDNGQRISIPSKVFEAISANKKIIYLRQNHGSNTEKILESYKNVFVVDINSSNSIEKELKEFINLNVSKSNELKKFDSDYIFKVVEKNIEKFL